MPRDFVTAGGARPQKDHAVELAKAPPAGARGRESDRNELQAGSPPFRPGRT